MNIPTWRVLSILLLVTSVAGIIFTILPAVLAIRAGINVIQVIPPGMDFHNFQLVSPYDFLRLKSAVTLQTAAAIVYFIAVGVWVVVIGFLLGWINCWSSDYICVDEAFHKFFFAAAVAYIPILAVIATACAFVGNAVVRNLEARGFGVMAQPAVVAIPIAQPYHQFDNKV